MQKFLSSPTLFVSSLVILCSMTLLGCDKKASEPKTTAPASSTVSTSVTIVATDTQLASAGMATPPPLTSATSGTPISPTTTVSTLSPTLEFWVAYARVGAIQFLTQKFPNMTAEQKACLTSHEGDTSYSKQLQPFMNTILTPAETAEADKFFASDLGKKFAIMSKAQIDASIAMPEVSETETNAIMAEFQKPYMIKLQKQTANADPKMGKDMLIKSMVTEQTRCKIN